MEATLDKGATVRAILGELTATMSASRTIVAQTVAHHAVVLWSDPDDLSLCVLHHEDSGCPITLGRRFDATPTPTAQAHCPSCTVALGGAPLAVFPISLANGVGVVATFGVATATNRQRAAKAQRLTSILEAYLRATSSNERAERRSSGLALINHVGANLISDVDVETLFPRILQEIGEVIPFEGGNLYLWDEDESRLKLVASAGETPERRLVLEQTAWHRTPGATFRSRRTVVIADLLHDLPPRSLSRRVSSGRWVRSVLCVPIVYQSEALGVITLASTEPHAFNNDDDELVTTLANHVAVAISNAQRYGLVDQNLRSKLRALTNLRTIGQSILASLDTDVVLQRIVTGTAEAFPGADAAILLTDEGGGDLIVAAAAGGSAPIVGSSVSSARSPSGLVVERGEHLLIPTEPDEVFATVRLQSEAHGSKAYLGVPLTLIDRTIGVLAVYFRRERGIEAHEVELLEGLAAQATIAIEHADLYEAIASDKRQLETIVESLQQGLVLVDRDRRVLYASSQFRLLLSEPDVMPSKRLDEVWASVVTRAEQPDVARTALQQLDESPVEPVLMTLVAPIRRTLELEGFDVSPHDVDGGNRGYLIRDVTHQAQIEHLKASLLATVSHELRAPLASIKGFATSLMREDVAWDEGRKTDFVVQIDRETDRLASLVTSLLDMSRFEAGAVRLDIEWCELGEWLDAILDRFGPFVPDHDLRLEPSAGRVVGLVDRRYLERLIWNLVDNAAKNSSEGSTISVGVAEGPRCVRLWVTDQGTGVPVGAREQIFERFYRGEAARPGGVGLGLAICRAIARAHSGDIEVLDAEGGGATFLVTLPVPAGPARTTHQ